MHAPVFCPPRLPPPPPPRATLGSGGSYTPQTATASSNSRPPTRNMFSFNRIVRDMRYILRYIYVHIYGSTKYDMYMFK